MLRHALAALAAVVAFAPAAAAQSPFTYQGELFDAGQPVTTPTDFRFRLFNNPNAGTQIGPDNNKAVTPGPDGRFVTILDFGPVFGAFGRHLEIAVRPAWNGQGIEPPYTILTPRTLITPAPVALYALEAPQAPVDWSDLLNTPAGFADGVDNDTTYNAGLGLRLLAGNLSLDLGFADARFINESATASGDLSGPLTAPTVESLQGTPLNISGMGVGDVLTWTGGDWKSVAPEIPPFGAGVGLDYAGFTFSLRNTPTSLTLVTGGAAVATAGGRIGINTTPSDMLHINAPAGENPFRVQADGATALRVYANGGVSLGASNVNTAADTVYVSGRLGVGTPTPDYGIHVIGGSGANSIRLEDSTTGIGSTHSSRNLSFGADADIYAFTDLRVRSNQDMQIDSYTQIELGASYLPLLMLHADRIELDAFEFALDALDSVEISSFLVRLDADTIIDQDLTVLGSAFKPGGGNWSVLSDERTKTDIEPIQNALDTITALRPVTFRYRDPAHPLFAPGTLRGFIAQDVQHVVPEWVRPAGPAFDTTDAPGTLALTMTGFEALATGAIQELDTDLRRINDELRAENAHLRARIDRLERVVERMLGDR
jgi:hypothetical protein